tara:strand:- start:57 stop:206 length:150 start_codon:yes stop_codon:yes gene_type:complete
MIDNFALISTLNNLENIEKQYGKEFTERGLLNIVNTLLKTKNRGSIVWN